jgi:hypothetical protein
MRHFFVDTYRLVLWALTSSGTPQVSVALTTGDQ